MRVLGAVLRDIRGASPHQHSETDRWLGLIGYQVFISFFGFYLIFATHFDGVSPPVSGIVSYCVFWTVYCFVLLLFCLFWGLSYFIHLAFRTHVSSCVRDGINHPWSDLLFLGCDILRWYQSMVIINPIPFKPC
jgi:hypothetical protein